MSNPIILFILFLTILLLSESVSTSNQHPPNLLTWDGFALQSLQTRLWSSSNGRSSHPNLSSSELVALQQLWNISHQYVESLHKHSFPQLSASKLFSQTGVHLQGLTPNSYVSVSPYAFPCDRTPKDCVNYQGVKHDPKTCDPKQNGLPWVICDGHINQDAKTLTDRPQLERIFHMVMRLSLSGYLFRSKYMSSLAASLLKAWFINSSTKMEPSLAFGQCIPGVSAGRSSAFMDLSYLSRGFFDAVQLLYQSPYARDHWSDTEHNAFLLWCKQMLENMLNSQIERESRMANNHGVYYDTTVLAMALLEGGEESMRIARRVNGENDCWTKTGKWSWCVDGRLANQVDENGVLRFEIKRADAGHYIWYTLLANVHLGLLTKQVGKDLFKMNEFTKAADWPLRQRLNESAEWLPKEHKYAVYAYRMIGRETRNTTMERVVCDMMTGLSKMSPSAFWNPNVVGMDLLELAMPAQSYVKCQAWDRFPKMKMHKVIKLVSKWDRRDVIEVQEVPVVYLIVVPVFLFLIVSNLHRRFWRKSSKKV